MKLGWLLGVFAAVFVHAAVLLFGGIFFLDEQGDDGSLRTVDLLSEVEAAEKKEATVEPEPKTDDESEELESEEEQPPDAAEILRSLEATPMDSAPALDAASLGAIEAALSGVGGSGDFAQGMDFSSGGRIGGTGKIGGAGVNFDEAFSLAEMDQKPQAVVRISPLFPSEMRGKKVEGLVTVEFVVDAEGKVQNARVKESSHGAFEAPALSAIRKWKFEPGVRAGKRVATKMRLPIRFPSQ